MNVESNKIDEQLIVDIVNSMDDLPILSRLEFAKSLVFDKGGDKNSLPREASLVTAVRVLDGVIEALKKRPKTASAKPRYSEPPR